MWKEGGFIRHRRASVRLVRLAVAGALSLAAGKAGTTTYGADDLRTGWYPDQPSLTQSLVTGLAFGQQWSAAVTGQVYAQPLVSNGVVRPSSAKERAPPPGNTRRRRAAPLQDRDRERSAPRR